MTEETENQPQIEHEVKVEDESVVEIKEEVKDLVPELYRHHGGDPRQEDLTYAVLLSGIPTDFLNDSFEQFEETIKTTLKVGHNLKDEVIKKIIRIPVLDEKATNPNSALRALIWFTDKMQQCRCLSRVKNFAEEGQKVELVESLPQEFTHISDEDRQNLENGGGEAQNHSDNHQNHHEDDEDIVGDEVVDEGDDEEDDLMNDDEGHDEHEEDDDMMEEIKKEEEDNTMEGVEEKKETQKETTKKDDKKTDGPKKKVYEDEDEKAPFEMEWEGAPEFQWRLCEGNRDEKKLIIDNLLWADLNNVFIYRTIQKATSCEINFPARFAGEGHRAAYGKLILVFPAFIPIMDEALKHLVYFRSGDNRRIKVFLPQTTISLKRKEEFEAKLGRLIKPTQRMMELVIKILPKDYKPTLDDACGWFPEQSVIGCELVEDEMGKPCAIVRFETAQEAIAAHASKSFVVINRDKLKTEVDEKTEKSEKEEDNHHLTQCNVFMRGVEAHFGSLLTFYDQRKKAQEQSRQNRGGGGGKRPGPSNSSPQKRPGSTIRGPAQKKRAVSPGKRGGGGAPKDLSAPRGSTRGGGGSAGGHGGPSRNVGRGGGGGGPRRSSPLRTQPRNSSGGGGHPRGSGSSRGHPRGGSGRGGGSSGGGRGGRTGGGDRGMTRAPPRSNNYRTDSFSSSSSQRGPARADAFSGYGYAQFESRYNSGGGGGGGGGSSNDRVSVDPFGRPMYNTFSNSSSSSYHRGGDDRHGSGSSGGGFSSYQDSSRRRY